jgi:bifunctional DNase/RNase
VVLGEEGGQRRLPIVIGGFEAQAIAVALENMIPNRPLTHDLFKNTLSSFNIQIKEVLINNLMDGIFYAKLICLKDNKEYSIDSRTSDAIAMAVRFKAPIYTYEFIMEAAGVVLDDPDIEIKAQAEKKAPKSKEKSIQQLSDKALESLLEKALEKEDYEKAAEIRDELNRREKGEE